MSERWPPILGVVGFDGGYRSAVALAIPPEELLTGEGEFTGGGPERFGACCNADNSCTDGVTQFDCTSLGGIYQGDGTDCASVDCGGTLTGACCTNGECSILSESDCTDGGGNYLGDGTTCDEVCNCDSLTSVTLCKCGFPPFQDPIGGLYYLGYDCSGIFHDEVDPVTFWLTLTTYCCNNDCIVGESCCVQSWDVDTCTPGPTEPPDCEATCFSDPCSNCGNVQGVSDEYTTEMLIANTEALYVATFGICAGTLIHTLSPDESCCTVCCVIPVSIAPDGAFTDPFFQNN